MTNDISTTDILHEYVSNKQMILSMVVLKVGIDKENYDFPNFHVLLTTTLKQAFAENIALMML